MITACRSPNHAVPIELLVPTKAEQDQEIREAIHTASEHDAPCAGFRGAADNVLQRSRSAPPGRQTPRHGTEGRSSRRGHSDYDPTGVIRGVSRQSLGSHEASAEAPAHAAEAAGPCDAQSRSAGPQPSTTSTIPGTRAPVHDPTGKACGTRKAIFVQSTTFGGRNRAHGVSIPTHPIWHHSTVALASQPGRQSGALQRQLQPRIAAAR